MTIPILVVFVAVLAFLVPASAFVYRAKRLRKKNAGCKKKLVKDLKTPGWDQEVIDNLATWGNEDLKARLIGKGASPDAVLELEKAMSRERFRAMLIESNAQYDTASLRKKK